MAWYHRAKPGDKVVCIDDEWENNQGLDSSHLPKRGKVYVIGDVHNSRLYYHKNCTVFLRFDEFVDGFTALCFKPVHPKDTSKQVEKLKRLTTPEAVS